jgi:hypothetical protein
LHPVKKEISNLSQQAQTLTDGRRILRWERVNMAVVSMTQNMEVNMTERAKVNTTKGISTKMPADDVSSRAGIIMGAEPQAVDPADKLTTTWAALKEL